MQHSCSHYNAICNHSFRKRIEQVLDHTTTVESIPRQDIKNHDKRVARVAHTLFNWRFVQKHATNQTKHATNQTKHATNQTKHATNQTKHATNQTKHATNQTKHATNQVAQVAIIGH